MITSISAGIVAVVTLITSAVLDVLESRGIVHLEGDNK